MDSFYLQISKGFPDPANSIWPIPAKVWHPDHFRGELSNIEWDGEGYPPYRLARYVEEGELTPAQVEWEHANTVRQWMAERADMRSHADNLRTADARCAILEAQNSTQEKRLKAAMIRIECLESVLARFQHKANELSNVALGQIW